MKAQRRPLRVLGRCVKKPGALEGALPTGDPCPLQTPESSRSPCASVPLQDSVIFHLIQAASLSAPQGSTPAPEVTPAPGPGIRPRPSVPPVSLSSHSSDNLWASSHLGPGAAPAPGGGFGRRHCIYEAGKNERQHIPCLDLKTEVGRREVQRERTSLQSRLWFLHVSSRQVGRMI